LEDFEGFLSVDPDTESFRYRGRLPTVNRHCAAKGQKKIRRALVAGRIGCFPKEIIF
jgi:hypothetical protein